MEDYPFIMLLSLKIIFRLLPSITKYHDRKISGTVWIYVTVFKINKLFHSPIFLLMFQSSFEYTAYSNTEAYQILKHVLLPQLSNKRQFKTIWKTTFSIILLFI